MEQAPSEGNDLPLGPDMNCDYGTDGSNPLSFAVEAEFSSLTIEEMETRLEFNQPVQDEFVAYGLYYIYARAKGFSVRKDSVQRFSDGTTRARNFVCSSEGGKDEKCSKLTIPAYVKPTQRCNCKAKLRVARLKGQHWRVTSFRKEHNHDMYAPDQTYLLRSARHINPEMQKCIETMVACRIPAIKAYEFLETMLQGRENVGFTKKDMYDSMSRSKKHLLIEHSDVDLLMEHFMEMSNKEPNFFWNIEKDENKRLKVQDSWRVDENAKDASSHNGRLPVRLDPWLTQAAEVYTLEIFTLFQQEHNQLSNYSITGQQEVFGTSSISFTMISRRGKSHFATVLFDPHTSFVSCTCHKFETCGILCSHALKVLERVDVDFIPERYIKKRWTKSVQYKVCDVLSVSSSRTGVLPVVFAQEMVKKTYDLATRAQSHKEAREILVECLENANEKLNNWFQNMNIDGLAANDVLGVNEGSCQTDDKLLLDPLKRLTYAHKRHWEVGGKRGRERGQCSRTMRGRKRGGRGSQTIGDRCPSQEGYAQTFHGAMNVQLPFHPPSISSQSNVNQHVLMPFQGSCSASQSSATQPIKPMVQFPSSILASQPLQLRDQVAPFASQLLAKQHPWPSMSFTNTWVNGKDM